MFNWCSAMKAGMQSQPLLVTSILDHAARWDGEQVIDCQYACTICALQTAHMTSSGRMPQADVAQCSC